jgi:hypothetical protein
MVHSVCSVAFALRNSTLPLEINENQRKSGVKIRNVHGKFVHVTAAQLCLSAHNCTMTTSACNCIRTVSTHSIYSGFD